MPDDRVKLEQKFAIPFRRQTVGDCIEGNRMRLEFPAGFVCTQDKIHEEVGHALGSKQSDNVDECSHAIAGIYRIERISPPSAGQIDFNASRGSMPHGHPDLIEVQKIP